jgi:hypothetical protein
LQSGLGSDEVRWKEVAVHAVRILSGSGKYLFVTADQLMTNSSSVDHARNDGIKIITIPDSIQRDVVGMTDLSGEPIRDLGQYQSEWNDSFVFDFVDPSALSAAERSVFDTLEAVAALVGGLPDHVKSVRVSNTMRLELGTGSDALGLWDGSTKSIVIRRDQLSSVSSFAGTLLHEIVHARTGFDDVTRDFENALTDVIGQTAATALAAVQRPKSLLNGLFGRA